MKRVWANFTLKRRSERVNLLLARVVFCVCFQGGVYETQRWLAVLWLGVPALRTLLFYLFYQGAQVTQMMDAHTVVCFDIFCLISFSLCFPER